jgi:hypothetical protein
VAAWYWAWAAFPVFGLTFTFTLLLFPTGRLLSARWRPVAWLAGLDLGAVTVLAALQPTLTVGYGKRAIANPIGISGLAHPEQGAVGAVLTGLFAVTAIAACVAGAALSVRPGGGAPAGQVVRLCRELDGYRFACRGSACSR